MGSSLTRMVLTNTAPPTDAWAPPAIAGSREGRGLSHQQLGRLWGHQNGSTMGAGTVATGFPRKGGNLAPSKYGERWSKPHFKGSTLQETNSLRTGSHGPRGFSYKYVL